MSDLDKTSIGFGRKPVRRARLALEEVLQPFPLSQFCHQEGRARVAVSCATIGNEATNGRGVLAP